MPKQRKYNVYVRINFDNAFEIKAVIKRVERDLQRLGYKYAIMKELMKDFYPNEKF